MRSLHAEARRRRIKVAEVLSFKIRHSQSRILASHSLMQKRQMPNKFHVLLGTPPCSALARRRQRELGIIHISGVIAQEIGGRLVSIEDIHSR